MGRSGLCQRAAGGAATLSDDLAPKLDAIEAKLDRLLRERSMANQRFFGVADAAGLTGLSEESIRRLLSAGKLTPLRPLRGKILIDRRELENLVLTSTKTPRTGRGRPKAK